MMNAEKVLEELVLACPSFELAWRQYLSREYPGDTGKQEERLTYVDVGELARHLVDLVISGTTEEVPRVFAVAEGLYGQVGPRTQVANFLTIGFLESVQNNALGRDLDPSRFEPWLGPRTLREWGALNAFWGGRQSTESEDAG